MAQDHRPIWVADSETDPFNLGIIPKPFIWGVYNGYGSGFYIEFTSTDDFVDYVAKRDIILYAHNGGKFDWHFISHRFVAGSDLLIINGRLSRFQIGRCEFRDSFNLMPVSLDQYQKEKIDYTKMHYLYREQHMPEIRTYLKSDCVNLWNMVQGFDETYGRHITQASAAMSFWQYRLNNKIPRSDAEFYDIIKPFYYGGRVQCFEYGDLAAPEGKNFQSIDINSAYPFAMLSEHPYSIDYVRKDGKPRKNIKNWGPMLFTVECIARGCFPYRGTNKNLYFPADDVNRRYFVTGWEVMTALETETVEDLVILEHYDFDETQNFSEYVNHFWQARQDFKAAGDKGGEFYCKIFLNSLYGKFGMDIRKHKNYTLKPRGEIPQLIASLKDGETIQDFKEWAILAEQAALGKKRFYNLATAASITGYVRAMLWRAICGAERPLYCDTDSITAHGFGKNVRLSKELGAWEVEAVYDRAVICGKKLYAMHKVGDFAEKIKQKMRDDPNIRSKREAISKVEWKLASKGAKLDHEDLIRIAAGEKVQYNNIVPTFSMSKAKPTFVSREIKITASDIRTVPKGYDPKYAHLSDEEKAALE